MLDKTINLLVWQGQEGQGRCQISLTLQNTGSGINGLLIGGEKPHVGGVVLALPRPSLQGKGMSSDLFITPVPGHKDADVARKAADSLAREFHCTVVITAGIHSDKLSSDELSQIIRNCESLTEAGIEYFKQLTD